VRSAVGIVVLTADNDITEDDGAACREDVADSKIVCAVEGTGEDASFGSRLGALTSGSLMDLRLT